MKRLFEMDEATLIEVLEAAIDNITDWLIIGDEYGRIIYVNEAVKRDCLADDEEILGQDMCMFAGADLTDEVMVSHIQEFVQKKDKFNFISTRFNKKNERIYLANQLFRVEGKIKEHCVCISKDITHTQKLKEEIYKANYFDSLTNYPNYKIFLERLNRQIYRCKKCGEKFAVIFVDIKGIGEINSLYNMTIGDFVIKEIGQRLNDAAGLKQEVFKCQGNAFAVIYQDYKGKACLEKFISTLYKKVEEPIKVNNRDIMAGIYVGVSLYPENGVKAAELVESAQTALLHAKKEKNDHFVFYSEEIKKLEDDRLQIETELQKAVRNDEFVVHYQPFVDLKRDKLVGMEALVRRQKEDGQIIPPGQFIGMLEELNLIEKVGMNILEKVCRQLREWMDEGYEVVPVSVNLSPVQFKNPQLADNIEQILARYQIDPRYVVLEITESTVMEDVSIARRSVDRLKSEGFTISIDDFGTGYASIGYLKKFMFDHLKIDISFVREIVANHEDRSIVQAIISIAKALNLKTIAEGIENEEQLHVMSSLGCEMGQGFLWDRPIDAETIEKKYFINQAY